MGITESTGSDEMPAIDAKDYGFDDEAVQAYDFEFYKGKKGFTDRLGLLREAGPFGARVHYSKIGNLGYFVCLSEFKQMKSPDGRVTELPVKLGLCCKKVGSDNLRKRFIVPVIKYSTHPNGTPTKDFSYSLLAWRYTDEKYIQMRTINSQFPLNKHDILVTCTNEDWQKLNIQGCNNSIRLLPKFPKDWTEHVNLWSATMLPKMVKTLGRKYTEQELAERLGLVPAQNQAAVAQRDQPVMDLSALLSD
jgi:hypothetical protein